MTSVQDLLDELNAPQRRAPVLITVIGILAVAAIFGLLLHLSKADRCPLWFPVLMLCLIEILRILPLGH